MHWEIMAKRLLLDYHKTLPLNGLQAATVLLLIYGVTCKLLVFFNFCIYECILKFRILKLAFEVVVGSYVVKYSL